MGQNSPHTPIELGWNKFISAIILFPILKLIKAFYNENFQKTIDWGIFYLSNFRGEYG